MILIQKTRTWLAEQDYAGQIGSVYDASGARGKIIKTRTEILGEESKCRPIQFESNERLAQRLELVVFICCLALLRPLRITAG